LGALHQLWGNLPSALLDASLHRLLQLAPNTRLQQDGEVRNRCWAANLGALLPGAL
jgi:hypothetical protein